MINNAFNFIGLQIAKYLPNTILRQIGTQK
jgi:hypothetical protein